MQKLNFNIDDELVLIEKYEITPTEMFVARLILLAQESDEEQQYLAKFLSHKDEFEKYNLSSFEMQTIIAYEFFKEANLNLVIMLKKEV